MTLRSLNTASVGSPITRLGVSLFPVYLPASQLPVINTGPDAGLVVSELDSASVPTLLAHNPTDMPILVVEGEHYLGGKQNRSLNATVLVDAQTKLEIPVSCLEQGRWGRERAYRQGESFAPRKVRRAKSSAVYASMRVSGSRHGDQGAVWNAVDEELQQHRVDSQTSAAADLRRDDAGWSQAVSEVARHGPLPGQCGIAVGHGSWILAVELFGAPNLLQAHWAKLVRSYLLDRPGETGPPSASWALRIIRRFASAEAHESPGVGLGTEIRVRIPSLVGQCLALEGMVVHASVFAQE